MLIIAILSLLINLAILILMYRSDMKNKKQPSCTSEVETTVFISYYCRRVR